MSDGATILLIGPETRRAACELVQQAPQGWMVRIGEPPRTLEQSSRFWATCRDVARSGATWDGERQTKQGWHDLFLSAWLVATRQRSPRLMIGLEGERVCLIPHSRDLSEREMSEVLDYIGAWCAMRSIPLKED